MGLYYSFISLDDQQLKRRRELLDRYGQIAQLSALVPLLVIYISFFSRYIISKYLSRLFHTAQKAHQSPRVPTFPQSTAGSLKASWRRFNWALDDEVLKGWDGWGTKRQWVIAGLWALWLLLLVVSDTGNGMYGFHSLSLFYSLSAP